MRALLILLLLITGPLLASGTEARVKELDAEIVSTRAEIRSVAESLESPRETGWWNLVERRRREQRLRRLRQLQKRLEASEKELEALKKP